MDPKVLFQKVVKQAEPCILEIRPDEFSNPTPCSDWDLRALLNHLVYELLWVPELLNGKTVAEVGSKFDGDVLGDDPVAAWKKASSEAAKAVERTDLAAQVHLSSRDVPASEYIMEMSNDVLIHGWDVGQSINCSLIFEPEVAQALYDFIEPQAAEWRAGGSFGDEVTVSADAGLQTKLLALEGRRDRP